MDQVMSELVVIIYQLSQKPLEKLTFENVKGEMGVLHHLCFEQDGLTPGELRTNLCVSSGRMADILKSLEKKKWIKRVPDSNDKRKVRVYILEEGKETVIQTKEDMYEKLSGYVEYMGIEDTKELVRLLNKVKEYIDLRRENNE